jgi:hypothetical protein
MNLRRAVLVVAVAGIATSCSESAPPARENAASEAPREQTPNSQAPAAGGGDELQPRQAKIERDSAALVRGTKVIPAPAAASDCPGCPTGGTDVLTFRQMKTDSITCSGDTCTVVVTIRAEFNPGSGERVAGGLTAWIPPEQRDAYLSGHTPPGEQAFRVQITYRRRGSAWQAIEFDRAPGG